MWWIGPLFGCLLFAAALVAGAAPDDKPQGGRMSSRGLATSCVALLGVGWALAMITAPIAPSYPEVMLTWAALDAVCGVVVALMWVKHLKVWLLALVLLYFGQSFIHVQYSTGQIQGVHAYQAWVNALLGGQILAVSWPGGRHVASRLFNAVFPAPRRSARQRAAQSRKAP